MTERNEKLEIFLTEIGLNENEAKVYLACLGLGLVTVAQISLHTEIKRTTVYNIIETLEQKKLVSFVLDGLKKKVQAVDPNLLNGLIDGWKDKLNLLLPSFLELQASDFLNSKITTIKSHNEIKQEYKKLLEELEPKSLYCGIGNQDKWLELDHKFYAEFIAKRAKLDLKIKFILTDGVIGNYYYKHQKDFGMEMKLFQQTDLNVSFVLTAKKLFIHELNKPETLIIIQNSDVIGFMRVVFGWLWKSI